MNVLVLLIFVSLIVATVFLICFIWAVRSGQYEDTSTPPMRLLLEEPRVARPSTSFKTPPNQTSS